MLAKSRTEPLYVFSRKTQATHATKRAYSPAITCHVEYPSVLELLQTWQELREYCKEKSPGVRDGAPLRVAVLYSFPPATAAKTATPVIRIS